MHKSEPKVQFMKGIETVAIQSSGSEPSGGCFVLMGSPATSLPLPQAEPDHPKKDRNGRRMKSLKLEWMYELFILTLLLFSDERPRNKFTSENPVIWRRDERQQRGASTNRPCNFADHHHFQRALNRPTGGHCVGRRGKWKPTDVRR